MARLFICRSPNVLRAMLRALLRSRSWSTNKGVSLKRALNHLDSVHQQLSTAVSSLDPELFLQRPAENEWSIGEVIHHLCLVEERVHGDLQKALQRPPVKVGLLKKLLPMRIVSMRF